MIIIDALRFYTICSFSLFVFSVQAQNNAIKASEISSLLEFQQKSRPAFEELMKCNISKDTLRSNLPYGYGTAISVLKSHFRRIDSFLVSPNAKNYAKALICADFVYAAFSYRLLGDQPGMMNDSVSRDVFNKLSLRQRYQLGNHNHVAVYCFERSAFFITLIDSLLGLKAYPKHISNIHSFPLVIIGGKRYIIDPYDPFVVLSVNKDIILEYSSVFKFEANNIKICRTKRLFGSSRELISEPLLKMQGTRLGVCALVKHMKFLSENYLRQESSRDLSKVHLPDFRRVYPIASNKRFLYALPLNTRPDGRLVSLADLRKFYYPQLLN